MTHAHFIWGAWHCFAVADFYCTLLFIQEKLLPISNLYSFLFCVCMCTRLYDVHMCMCAFFPWSTIQITIHNNNLKANQLSYIIIEKMQFIIINVVIWYVKKYRRSLVSEMDKSLFHYFSLEPHFCFANLNSSFQLWNFCVSCW